MNTFRKELWCCQEHRNQVSSTENGVDVDNCELWLPHSCYTRFNYPHAGVVTGGIVNTIKPAYDSTRILTTLK